MSRTETLMNAMNTPILAAISLAAFLALTVYSYDNRPENHGYDKSEIERLNQMSSNAEVVLWRSAKPTPKAGWTKAEMDKAYKDLFASN